jgi:hypothetical protein
MMAEAQKQQKHFAVLTLRQLTMATGSVSECRLASWRLQGQVAAANVIASIYPVMEDKRKRQTEAIKRRRKYKVWEGVSKSIKRKNDYFRTSLVGRTLSWQFTHGLLFRLRSCWNVLPMSRHSSYLKVMGKIFVCKSHSNPPEFRSYCFYEHIFALNFTALVDTLSPECLWIFHFVSNKCPAS